MSEHLNIPQLTFAVKIDVDGEYALVDREVDEGIMSLKAKLPVLCTVGKDINEPRTATMKGKMRAKKMTVKVINSADIGNMDTSKMGLKGSPTRVKKTFTPSVKKAGMKVEGKSAAEAVEALLGDMKAKALI